MPPPDTRQRPAGQPGEVNRSLDGVSDTYQLTPLTLESVRATVIGRTLTIEQYRFVDGLGVITSPITWPPGRITRRHRHTPEPAGHGPVRGERSPRHAALLRAKSGVR